MAEHRRCLDDMWPLGSTLDTDISGYPSRPCFGKDFPLDGWNLKIYSWHFVASRKIWKWCNKIFNCHGICDEPRAEPCSTSDLGDFIKVCRHLLSVSIYSPIKIMSFCRFFLHLGLTNFQVLQRQILLLGLYAHWCSALIKFQGKTDVASSGPRAGTWKDRYLHWRFSDPNLTLILIFSSECLLWTLAGAPGPWIGKSRDSKGQRCQEGNS